MNKYIYELSKRQLRDLYNELCDQDEDSPLFQSVEERLDYIKKVDSGVIGYSSDRVVEHSEDDEKRWEDFMMGFNVSDFPFAKGRVLGFSGLSRT